MNGIMALPENKKAISDAVFGNLAGVDHFTKVGYSSKTATHPWWNSWGHEAGSARLTSFIAGKLESEMVDMFDSCESTDHPSDGDLISLTPKELQRSLDWDKAHAPGDRIKTTFGAYRYVQFGGGSIGSGEVLGPVKETTIRKINNFFPDSMLDGYEEGGLPMGPQLTPDEQYVIYRRCAYEIEGRKRGLLSDWRLAEVKRKIITACGFQVTLQHRLCGLVVFNI